jgi:hypothetical protein
MPARSIRPAVSSVISSLRSTMIGAVSPFFTLTVGSGSGAAARRPTSRRRNSRSSLESSRVIQLPSSVPQSSSRVMTSWATSTSRRVR